MKTKIVNVWYEDKGYVPFIVLQLEKGDTTLTTHGFDPGYKFIIQAIYHNVGAVGGHKFNPYYQESAKDMSRKINTTEADVLGFYLSSVKDIYDIPSDLDTRGFWDVVHTSQTMDKYNNFVLEDSYKVILSTSYESFTDKKNQVLEALDGLSSSLDYADEIREDLQKKEKYFDRFQFDKDLRKRHLYLKYIDKNTLKEVYSTWITSQRGIIADYLWSPSEPLPDNLWEKCKKVNDDYSHLRIYYPEEERIIFE